MHLPTPPPPAVRRSHGLWLLEGNSLAVLDLSALEWVFASSRSLLVVAVVGAVSSVFAPAANRWFAASPAMIGATS